VSAAVAAESGGMPQLDPSSFSSQIFWLIVSFTLLYIAMSRSVIPRIRDVLEKRQHQIVDNIDAAEMAKQQAADAQSAYEAELDSAKHKTHDLLHSTQSEMAGMMASELASLNKKLDAQLDKVQTDLAAQRQQTLAEMEPHLQELTGMVVAQISGSKPDSARVAAAVKQRMGA